MLDPGLKLLPKVILGLLESGLCLGLAFGLRWGVELVFKLGVELGLGLKLWLGVDFPYW